MKTIILAALVIAGGVAAGSGFSTPAAACSDSPFIGSVCFIASQFCPYPYLEANGAILAVREYQALFSLVGDRFGGDGINTFGIPNLRARHPVGWGAVSGLTAVGYGQYVGQESVRLSQTQMAPHDHPAVFTPNVDKTRSKYTVTTTSVPGTLDVAAKLPLVTAVPGTATATPAPVTGNSNYLGAVTAKAANGPANYTVSFSGLFSQTDPGATATAPVTTSVTGSPTIPAFAFDVPTGGTVTVGYNITAAQQVATPVRDPAVGLTACIAVNGTYPTRP